jgi:hypothetical protein
MEYVMPSLWQFPDDLPVNQIGIYDRHIGPDRFLFLSGRRIGEGLGVRPLVRFDCESSKLRENDCLWTDGQVPLVNDRLRAFLNKKASGKVEFFDVELVNADGEMTGYHILNVINIISVIDVSTSQYRLIPGTDRIMAFDKIDIDHNFFDGMELGRELCYLPYLFSGKELAETMKCEKFSGIDLLEPAQIHQ